MVWEANPYTSGVPSSPTQIFNLTNNIFYFDRGSKTTPAFYIQGGCTYTAGFPFSSFEQFTSNLYWRTDGAFASDPQAFHTQLDPVSPTNPCFGAASQRQWAFFSFANWQKTGEDLQSVIQNPGFSNPTYPADDFSLPKGSPGVGFVVFDPNQAGRTNPVMMPPAVPATFQTRTFNPATDY